MKKKTIDKITDKEKEQCEKCQYRCSLSNTICCDYFMITGELRNSPVGQLCNKFAEGPKINTNDEILRGKNFRLQQEKSDAINKELDYKENNSRLRWQIGGKR